VSRRTEATAPRFSSGRMGRGHNHFYVLSSGVWGVFDFCVVAWGSAGVPRSVRGRPWQVKGAFGVADAMPLRGTLDLRASRDPWSLER
jgi:hypothetical protein